MFGYEIDHPNLQLLKIDQIEFTDDENSSFRVDRNVLNEHVIASDQASIDRTQRNKNKNSIWFSLY